MKLKSLFHSIIYFSYFYCSFAVFMGSISIGSKLKVWDPILIYRNVANEPQSQGINVDSLVEKLEKTENNIIYWNDFLEALSLTSGLPALFKSPEESLLNQELKSIKENEEVQDSEPFQYHTRYQ